MARVVHAMLTLAAIFLLSFDAVATQEPGAALREKLRSEVTTRLRSDSPATIAWGGFFAAEHRVVETGAQLSAALEKVRDPKSQEARLAAAALLDGLVRIGARPDAAVLEPFVARGVPPALILAARRPEAHVEALRTCFDGRNASPDMGWLLAGNLLVQAEAEGFAEIVCSGLRLRLRVRVVDPGSAGGGGRSRQTSRGDGVVQVPDGFPPIVRYELSRSPSFGSLVVSAGPPRVFARRRTYERKKFSIGTTRRWSPDEVRYEWLRTLAVSKPPFELESALQVEWHDPGSMRESVDAKREEIQAQFTKHLRLLVQRGHIDQNLANTLAVAIDVRVTDLRSDKALPLPAVGRD